MKTQRAGQTQQTLVEQGNGRLVVTKSGLAGEVAEGSAEGLAALQTEMGPCPHTHVHSPLAEALQSPIRVCNATLEAYRGEAESPTGASFFASLVLALAGIERAIDSGFGDPAHEASLLIAASLCREAASSIRKHGLDADLLRCADACERAAHVCQAAVGNAQT